ncbi:MAG TPA: XRE family transcriptional regulator [Candidatus Limnocylindrales bacterium]|nr:XRE family transcriptional regulator [Candidatus Limnocylindrales bacterium]
MATELAPVTPSVMKWARETIGVSLEEAARRAGVKPERVQEWESGKKEPTVAKLRTLAKFYQRPLSVFFLPEPPPDFSTIRDFRRNPGQDDLLWSLSLHKVYRRALEQQEITEDILDDDGEHALVRVPSAAISDGAETVADVARQALGVSLREQFSWRRPEEAFAGWLQAVEDLGVFVLRTSDVSVDEMRGLSISSGAVPVIVINALDWPRGQVFTLAHELVHLILRQGGLCDLLEPSAGSARRVETFCNAAASAMLMPEDAFLDSSVVGPPGEREWEDEVLVQLGARFGVSQEAVLRRLVTLKRASMDFYLQKRQEYLEIYHEQREEEKERRRQRDSQGGPPPHRMAIRDRGKPYVRLVLDAYHRDVIGPSTLSSFLGLKLRHIPALEHEVRG